MNYRHAFHAGNFADVFKHTILIGLLDALKQKAAPFCYFDTHAGTGSYDLRGVEAEKTAEAADGVLRLLDVKSPQPLLQAYLDLLRSLNPAGAGRELALYPGSPLIAAKTMRDTDRAVLCELQPDEAAQLKKLFAHDARVGVHQRDGYTALGALVPPKERRGLVLVDPPFEAQDDEFRAVEAALDTAYSRWPTGIYAIWYPIKLREQTRPFHRWFASNKIGKTLVVELLRQPDDSALRLNGCGMVIVNPPWQFDQQLRQLMPVLQERLKVSGPGQVRLDWLTRE
jgi:23S rRNA (adenine2030-N6)-methyltransferase